MCNNGFLFQNLITLPKSSRLGSTNRTSRFLFGPLGNIMNALGDFRPTLGEDDDDYEEETFRNCTCGIDD